MSANRNIEKQIQGKEQEATPVPIPEEVHGLEKIKLFLKKNWLLLSAMVVVVGLYFGLQQAKKMMQPGTGANASYVNPPAPDLAQSNQNKQEAQDKTDRISLVDQSLSQADASKPVAAIAKTDSQANFVKYQSANAYQKTPVNSTGVATKTISTATITAVPSPKVEPKSSEKASSPMGKTPIREGQKLRKYDERDRNKWEEKGSISSPNKQDGFNTVVLNSPTLSSSVSKTHSKIEYIKAAVYGNQTIRSGSQVRVRLLQAMTLDEIEVPANSICTGIAMLGANRVSIALTSVQVRGQNYALKKVVCDKDLVPGIAFTNENALQQSARQQRNSSIDQTTNTMMNTIPQVGGMTGVAIATGTGIVHGISNSLRYGGVQKRVGEIDLEEGYKVFIIN